MRRRARPASGRSLLARIATRSVDWERSEPKTAGRGFPWLFASGNDLSLKSPSRHHTSQDTTAHSDRSLIQPVGSAGTPGLSLAAKSPFTFLSSPPQVSAAPRQGASRPRLASNREQTPRGSGTRWNHWFHPLKAGHGSMPNAATWQDIAIDRVTLSQGSSSAPGPDARVEAFESARVQTLRGIACLLLVAFHAVGATTASGLHVPDDSPYRVFSNLFAYIRMPLFTFLSPGLYTPIDLCGRELSCNSLARNFAASACP